MNYNTDRPIDSGEQDLLGRLSFSNQLGRAIYEFDGKDGLVIGLFGKWGTGKTSVVNMAVNEINRLTEKDKNKPIIMRFIPWSFSENNNLISLFFQCLKNKINIQDDEEIKKKVGKALSDYSGVFDALSLVPIVGSGVAAILKTVAQAKGINLMQNADLDETKRILEKELINAEKKIVIIIDDIDRLTNPQIRDVFQLVKQVADFPNVVYVLVMDREIVRSALSEVHNIDGNEYLEKIIQVPFELPELRKPKLHNIFFSKLEQTIGSLQHEAHLDENYWGNVFRNCIEPYINTLRDVNRVINTFQFRYGMLYQETSFEDMISITTLEVLEPELYKWICNNKDAVCGGLMHGFLSHGGSKPDYRKKYYDEFKSMGIDPDLAIKCVSTMFPIFANDVNEYQYISHPAQDNKGKMRIADEKRFDMYFAFDLDDIKVSRNIINACIYALDKNSLNSIIEEINEQGNIIYFLEEIESLADKIPYERLSIIASSLLSLQGKFKGENSKFILSISACDRAEYLTESIIKRLNTEEERYSVVRSAVENANKSGLGTIAKMINRSELAHGRLAGKSERKNEQLVSLEHLEELEKTYVKKINDIVNIESIIDIDELGLVLYLWESFDNTGANSYMKKLLNNDVNKLRFICTTASKWRGTNGSGWSFYPEYYSNYISKDEVYSLIQSLDKEKLEAFTEIELIKLASFSLDYHNDDMDYVNEKDAIKLVNEWKEKITV